MASADPIPVPFENCNSNDAFSPSRVIAQYHSHTHYLSYAVQGNISSSVKGVSTNYYATTVLDVSAVGFQQTKQRYEFCNTTDTGCPFGPGNVSFGNDIHLPNTYFLTTLTTHVIVLDENTPPNQIACLNFQVTPNSPQYASVFVWAPIAVFIITAVVNLVTMFFNPWTGTLNPHKATSGWGMNVNTIRSVTPGFFDVLLYFQFIVSTMQLSLNFPGFMPAALSYLGWADLIFANTFTGDLAIADGTYVNSTIDELTQTSYSASLDGLPASLFNSSQNDLISIDTHNYGMQTFANLVGVPAHSLFPDFMVLFVIISVIVCALNLLTWAFSALFKSDDISAKQNRDRHYYFWLGSLLRVFYFFYFPMTTFAFFQLSIHAVASSISVAFAALTVGGLVLALPIFLLYQLHTRQVSLYDGMLTMFAFGSLYNNYRGGGATLFCGIIFLWSAVKGIVIGSAQVAGVAQAFVLVVCEVLFLISLVVWKPYYPRTGMNALSVLFAAARIIISILLLLFVPQFDVSSPVREWIAYIILAIHAIVLFVFLLCALKTMIEMLMRACGAPLTEDNEDDGAVSGFGAMMLKSGRGFRQRMSLMDHDEEVAHKRSTSDLRRDDLPYKHDGYRPPSVQPMLAMEEVDETGRPLYSPRYGYRGHGRNSSLGYESSYDPHSSSINSVRHSTYSSVGSDVAFLTHTGQLGINRPSPRSPRINLDRAPSDISHRTSPSIVSANQSTPSPSVWHDKLLSNSNLPKRTQDEDDYFSVISPDDPNGSGRFKKLRRGHQQHNSAAEARRTSEVSLDERPRRLSAPLLDKFINENADSSRSITRVVTDSSMGSKRPASLSSTMMLESVPTKPQTKKVRFGGAIGGLLSKVLPKGTSDKNIVSSGFVVKNRGAVPPPMQPLMGSLPMSPASGRASTLLATTFEEDGPNAPLNSLGRRQLVNAFGAADDDDEQGKAGVVMRDSSDTIKEIEGNKTSEAIAEDSEDEFLEPPPSLAALTSSLSPERHPRSLSEGPTEQQQYQMPTEARSSTDGTGLDTRQYRIMNPDEYESQRNSQASLGDGSLHRFSGGSLSHRSSGVTLHSKFLEHSPSTRVTRELEPERASLEGGPVLSDIISGSTPTQGPPKLSMPALRDLRRQPTTDGDRRARRTALLEAVANKNRRTTGPLAPLDTDILQRKQSVRSNTTLETLDTTYTDETGQRSAHASSSGIPSGVDARSFEQEVQTYFDSVLKK